MANGISAISYNVLLQDIKKLWYTTLVPTCRSKKETGISMWITQIIWNVKYVIKMDAMDPVTSTLRFEQAGTQDFS
jgi:hypothetical protein